MVCLGMTIKDKKHRSESKVQISQLAIEHVKWTVGFWEALTQSDRFRHISEEKPRQNEGRCSGLPV